MKISNIKIDRIEGEASNVKAIVTLTFDDFILIKDIKIVNTADGLLVIMPCQKTPTEEIEYYCQSTTSDFKNYIQNNVLDLFNSSETEKIFESEYFEPNIEFEFKLNEENSSLLADCSVYIDNEFAIHKIQMIREENGEIAVEFPYLANKKLYACELISNRDEFYEQIVDAYLKFSNNNSLSRIKVEQPINMKDYKVVQNEITYFEIDIPKDWKVFTRDRLNEITKETTKKASNENGEETAKKSEIEQLAFMFETKNDTEMMISITKLDENTFESAYNNIIKKLKEDGRYILSQNIIDNKSMYIMNLFIKNSDGSILCHNYFKKDEYFCHAYWKVSEDNKLNNIINSNEIKAIYSLRKMSDGGIIRKKSNAFVATNIMASEIFSESIKLIRDIINNHRNLDEKDFFIFYANELGCKYEETENGIIIYCVEPGRVEYIIENNKVQKIFGTLEDGKNYCFERKIAKKNNDGEGKNNAETNNN